MKTELLAAAEKAINKSVLDALTSYSSPLTQCVNEALADERHVLKGLASEAVSELINADEFKHQMKIELKRKLAKVLISQYGGEIEKSVGKLKSDEATRAKITLAIDGVMDELTK